MIKLLSFFSCLLFSLSLLSIDSLLLNQQLVQLEKSQGIEKLKLLRELSFSLRRDDNAKAKSLAEEGLILAGLLGDSIEYHKISSNLANINALDGKFETSIQLQSKVLFYHQRHNNRNAEGEALMNLGSIYADFGNHILADSLMEIGASIFRQEKDTNGLMDINLQRGINFLDWNKYSSAETSFQEALTIAKELKDTLVLSKLWNNLGIVARRQGNLEKALDHYFQASLSHQPADLFKAKIYNNIGIIYKSLSDFDKALEFYQKSLAIKERLNLKKSMAYTLHNMGTLAKEKLDYGEALKYYNRSLKLKEQLEGGNNGLAKTLNNIGNVYLNLGDYLKAEKHYRAHLKISEAEKNKDEICRALNNLSALYLKQENFQNAINYGLRSLQIAEQINYPRILRSASKNLSEAYKALGDSYKYLLYKNKYWEVNDSIINKETIQEIAKIERQYELSLLEQNTELQNKQLIDLERKWNKDRLKLVWIGVLLLLLLTGLIALVYQYFQRILAKAQQNWNLNLEKSSLKVELLEEKISHYQSQFSRQSDTLSEKEKEIKALENQIALLKTSEKPEPVLRDLHSFLNENLQTDQNWKEFQHYFTTVHKDFFKKLKSAYPRLTTYDLNLCAFLKLNLHNKEIAQILGISPLSVKKARQRLSKKMDIENNQTLVNYIIQL